jgi:hypothetical protein
MEAHMTDLRARLGKMAQWESDNHSEANGKLSMLALLWPVIEAANNYLTGKGGGELWHITQLEKALADLEGKLNDK